jgi:hypothetical protein
MAPDGLCAGLHFGFVVFIKQEEDALKFVIRHDKKNFV